MNKHARAMRDQYGVSYQRALNLLRAHGLDGALDVLQTEAEKRDEKKKEANQ